MSRLASVCGSLMFLLALPLLAAPPGPGLIAIFPAASEPQVRALGGEVWDRGEGFVLVGISRTRAEELSAGGIDATFAAPDEGQGIWLLSHDDTFPAPLLPGLVRFEIDEHQALYLVPVSEIEVGLRGAGLHAKFRGVPRRAMAERRPHPADAAPRLASPEAPTAANPLVQTIVNATSQANWYQYVRDLSADADVTIPGFCTACRIRTRASNYMFPLNNTGSPLGNPFATEYLEMKAAGWGYGGANSVRESYGQADSGCSSQGSMTWQNVIFTLPAQVDYAQHQQVIFLVHYDTISESAANDANNAPGADDAISGGAALIEAMRLFKDYGWKYPVKFLFVSGEEVGLCGSNAYTRQHSMTDVWRVLNMDQTAFDGDKNGLMNLYNWSTASCAGCVAFGDAFVQANTDYGSIIAPAKLVRNTSYMCQTDHCSFWNAGAVAIDLNEDLTNNDICPCFDQSQTSTCRDTVTQKYPTSSSTLMFDQNYSWPTEKAAIALIAHTAEPLYVCPGAGATVGATGSAGQVALTWGAVPPVTNYVVERAAGGCVGTFAGIAQVTSPGYTDTSITNGSTYGYRIRTCPFQYSNCVAVTPNGPSVNYQPGSALVTADTGDGDSFADNCERVTAQLTLVNDGNTPLTNVRLTSLVADSAAVQVVSPIPYLVGSLAVGASVQVPFRFDLGRSGTSATCQQAITFTATLASDQTSPLLRSFPLTSEQSSVTGTITWGFETNGSLDGWTVNAGVFTQVAGGTTGSTAYSLHSRTTQTNNDCDSVISPVFTPSASSTLTLAVNYVIETGNYDRAVVRAVNPATGVKTLLVPTGAVYNTTASASGLCDGLGSLQGWSGSHAGWRTATASLAAFAGTPIQIELRYSTDSSALGTQGFWFDYVQVTGATMLSCDAQTNTCASRPPEVSGNGAAVPFTIAKSGSNATLRFSESTGATKYNVYAGTLANLRRGYYDHAQASGLCGFTDGTVGDGQVLATVAQATLPADDYFLAVASGAAGESPYGSATVGTIPVAASSCP